MRLSYKHNTLDYRLLWDNTQSNYKDHDLNAVTWNNLYCKGIGKSVQIIQAFLRFPPKIQFICEKSAERLEPVWTSLNH